MTQFKFVPKDRYRNNVRVLIPGDFGDTQTVEFTVEFLRVATSKATTDLFARARAAASAENGDSFDAELMKLAVIGWEGLSDASDQPVPFSAGALAELMEIHCYRAALAQRFVDDLKVPTEIARKN